MKHKLTYISAILALALSCCHSNHNHDHSHHGHSHESHEHSHDGHDSHESHEHEHCEGEHDFHEHEHYEGEHDSHEHELEDSHAEEAHNHKDGEIVISHEQIHKFGIKTERAENRDFCKIVKTCGEILAAQGNESVIVSPSNGIATFASNSLTAGRAVRNGEVIAFVSSKDIENGDPSAKAKAAFDAAKSAYERAESLVKDKIISQKEYEQAKLNFENAQNEYLALSSKTTDKGIGVSSTLGGFVKEIHISNGEYVNVGQPVATVSQSRRLYLQVDVPEKHLSEMRNITGANFKLPYSDSLFRTSELKGKIISRGKSYGKNSCFVPVTFEFDNIGNIVQGSFAEVFLQIKSFKKVISVPLTALTESAGIYFVYLQTGDHSFVRQEVSIGSNDGERVEILKGLHEGNIVVTEGAIHVKLAENSAAIPEGHNHNH